MRPEVEFVLETLDSVVSNQPDAYPLRRVDRDNSQVYDGDGTLDMTTPITRREDDLQQANYVGAAWQSRDGDPIGQDYNLDGDIVVSCRVEGMRGTGALWGNVDPTGSEGVAWTTLTEDIRSAILNERTYPDHTSFTDHKLDLQVTNEDDVSADWRDFYRYDFDVVFDFREEL